MKTGQEHIASLRDGRAVFIDGAAVPDVTTSPAFARIVQTAGSFYDAALEQPEAFSFESPTSGARVGRAWQMPRTWEETVQRRQTLERMAELTCGMVGRSPDHVASTLVGMAMGADVMAGYDARGSAALGDYFRQARDRDLYLSYVIVNPQADKSQPVAGQPARDLVAHIVDEDSWGITVSGAKMLATSAIVAQELLVSNIQPLQEGDERYAFTAALPMNSKGLKFLSRRSYEQAATSSFDYPLASRFDENDAVVLFDEVRIPWERVFLIRQVKAAAAQWHETRAHVMQNHQCLVRLYVKLRFLVGVARRIAEANGIIGFPGVRDSLGALAAKATMIEAMVAGMEARGENFRGFHVPDRSMLCAAQAIAQQTYPQVIDAIRQLCGGGLIMVPSSVQDFHHPETLAIIRGSQKSPVMDSEDRVKLFKLAWDAVGSEFGSRHLQYEMFYSGSPMVLNAHNYRFFDWGRATGMVDGFMSGYSADAGGEAGSSAAVAQPSVAQPLMAQSSMAQSSIASTSTS